MAEDKPRKLVRSYRLVFRRRWRIFRIQNWRIPLPGGLELRLIGYWLACISAILIASALPYLGVVVCALPPSLRLLALPIGAAWALSRWEVDGRPPHRALFGLFGWAIRPRQLAGLRRCSAVGTELAPLGELAVGPDLSAPRYPRGRLKGPVRVLLRYPVAVERFRSLGSRQRWALRAIDAPALHKGKTLSIPAGARADFEVR